MDLPTISKKTSTSFNYSASVKTKDAQPSKLSILQKWKNTAQISSEINSEFKPNATLNGRIINKQSFQPKVSEGCQLNLLKSCKSIGPSRQKTVPKSRSTNLIVSKQNIPLPRKQAKLVLKYKAQSQIKTYSWRMNTHFPVIKVECTNSKQFQENRNQYSQQLQLQIKNSQDIQFILPQITQFNLMNSLYIIKQSLVSFQRLFNKFGFFQPTLKMVFITNNSKCKVWVNQNIWENSPVYLKSIQKQIQKVQNFYKKVINMFSTYFYSRIIKQPDHIKKSMNLMQKLIYELEQRNDFVQSLKFINQFLNVYSLKLNNRFIDPIQISERRSRIFSKVQIGRVPTKNVTMAQIPLKQQFQNDQKNIKTLKNSTQRYEVTKQSICKTIQKKSPVTKSKQIQFKKKSQVSFSSKQTIVQKKSRFSLHEDNEEQDILKQNVLQNLFPNFTNQDFNQISDEDDATAEYEQTMGFEHKQAMGLMQQSPGFFNLKKVDADQDGEYQQQMRSQIQKNVRQRNGWFQNPMFLFETDDCAKSFQDSQPSVRMQTRDRALTKLNRIKKSIANSILSGNYQ